MDLDFERLSERKRSMLAHILTDKETDLLLQILGDESQRLMLEARRTDASAMRKEIRERLRVVDRITERFVEIRAGNYKD